MIPVADQDLADVLADLQADEADRYVLDDCGACSGTGEGATCEATCWVCRGSGAVRLPVVDADAEPEPEPEPEPEDEDEAEVAHG